MGKEEAIGKLKEYAKEDKSSSKKINLGNHQFIHKIIPCYSLGRYDCYGKGTIGLTFSTFGTIYNKDPKKILKIIKAIEEAQDHGHNRH